MNKFRLLSMTLALVMALLTLASCGSKADKDTVDGSAETINTEIQKENEDARAEEESIETESDFTVKKIGKIETDYIYSLGAAGIIYKDENDKFGVMSPDGKQDSGAKYYNISQEGSYFIVETVEEINPDDISSLNGTGLIDASGKEIIPAKFATIDKLNDRYYKACEITERTTNEDEALVYFSSSMFSLSAGEDDPLYKGVWHVYDVTTGKPVDGATGTQAYTTSAYGNSLSYVTDNEEKITINAKGEKIPEGTNMFENGYYAITEGNSGTVYDNDGNKAFDFDKSGFTPQDSDDDYISASKYENDVRKFVYMDLKGNIVSAEFTDSPMLYGELVKAGDKLYSLDGTVINEGPISSVYHEKTYGEVWWLKNEDTYTMIDKDGNVLYEGISEDPYYCDTSLFNISKNDDAGRKYYSFADKDFTIDGSYLNSTWLFTVDGTNNLKNVVESISGATLIKGYSGYKSVDVPGFGSYIYANNDDGTYDVFTVEK